MIFLYEDIQWSISDSSDVHAQAGFNAGDGNRSTTIEGSQTASIVDIELSSNIGVPGKYLYRVDAEAISPTPPPPGMRHIDLCYLINTTLSCFSRTTYIATMEPIAIL